MICPFCNQQAEWCANEAIYGRNFGRSYMMYLCKPCDAYVGCHNNTTVPLGTMANREMREWRKKAHAVIDPLWRNGKHKRGEVYAKLSKAVGFEFHVGESDIEMCKYIINLVPQLFA